MLSLYTAISVSRVSETDPFSLAFLSSNNMLVAYDRRTPVWIAG
jgi:hypothetical protein